MSFFLNSVNPFLWLTSNIIVVIFSILLTFYVVFYCFFFEWWKQGGGRLIMAIMASFEGLVILVFIGAFTSPAGFGGYPDGTVPWRPIVRVLVYLAITLSVARLDLALISRWRAGRGIDFSVDKRNLRAVKPLPPELENTYPRATKPKLPRRSSRS